MKLFNNKFPNIFYKKAKRIKLYIKNSTPKERFFNEEIEIYKGEEYRLFDPKRSKLAAGLAKGLSQIGIKEDSYILYLGASHGYTCSFLSDICTSGFIFAVDFAPRVVRDLVFLCEKRKNIAPILADAAQPETYAHRIMQVDILYQDVAQRNQAEIFLNNCRFLTKGGFGLLAVKSRSIDITKKPKQIYHEVRKKLDKEVTVVDFKVLDPFEKDHCMFVIKK